jgi:hypothetical protein
MNRPRRKAVGTPSDHPRRPTIFIFLVLSLFAKEGLERRYRRLISDALQDVSSRSRQIQWPEDGDVRARPTISLMTTA